MNLSVADKLAIAPLLDELGVGFIEGGWPGAIPKDTEFFQRAAKELDLQQRASSRRSARPARPAPARRDDPQVRALLDSEAPGRHARRQERHPARRAGAADHRATENLAMIARHRRASSSARGAGSSSTPSTSSTATGSTPRTRVRAVPTGVRGRRRGRRAVRHQRRHAARRGSHEIVARGPRRRRAGRPARDARAQRLRLRGREHARRRRGRRRARAGHASTGTASGPATPTCSPSSPTSSSSTAAGCSPATACGTRPASRTRSARSPTSRPFARQPYIGASAFAHKAGLHASAIKVDPDLYQHIDPTLVGNDMRMLISDMAGRASIELKGRELGFDLAGPGRPAQPGHRPGQGRRGRRLHLRRRRRVLRAAAARGGRRRAARVLRRRELAHHRRDAAAAAPHEANAEATVKLHAGGERVVATGEGNGPVNALDHALRQALVGAYPEIERFELIDFKVRILDAAHGTDAVTRVLVETMDVGAETTWRTVGVGPNVIEASWEALVDSVVLRPAQGGRRAVVLTRGRASGRAVPGARPTAPPGARRLRGVTSDGVLRGEYKVPGGKLVAVDVRVEDGRLAGVALSGDFFLEPDDALGRIDAALTGQPEDLGVAGLAAAVDAALRPTRHAGRVHRRGGRDRGAARGRARHRVGRPHVRARPRGPAAAGRCTRRSTRCSPRSSPPDGAARPCGSGSGSSRR